MLHEYCGCCFCCFFQLYPIIHNIWPHLSQSESCVYTVASHSHTLDMAIHKHGISFRIKRLRNAQLKVLLRGSLQDGEEAESSPGQELHCCWPCTQTMLIIPYWMFCALGVALFVHDEWLQPQMFRVGTFSMDTSSCYMFRNSSSLRQHVRHAEGRLCFNWSGIPYSELRLLNRCRCARLKQPFCFAVHASGMQDTTLPGAYERQSRNFAAHKLLTLLMSCHYDSGRVSKEQCADKHYYGKHVYWIEEVIILLRIEEAMERYNNFNWKAMLVKLIFCGLYNCK